jgi:hypothetical protein
MINVSPVLDSLAHREMMRGVALNNSGNPNLAVLAFHRHNTFTQAADLERELLCEPEVYPLATVLPHETRWKREGVAAMAGWGVIILALAVLAWF